MAYFVGLTGGIGSGKSTVSQMLSERGAVVVDADKIVRELQHPGTEVYEEIVEAFGPDVVAPDGSLDRSRLAEVVFADPDQLERLNRITWPRVGERFAQRVAELREGDRIVVLDIPLLGASSEGSGRVADIVVVVTASEEVRLERLAARGMDAEDAKARMAAQITDDQRREIADHILDNDGTLVQLEAQVAELWRRLEEAARG